jgi:hypothetical protein
MGYGVLFVFLLVIARKGRRCDCASSQRQSDGIELEHLNFLYVTVKIDCPN